MANVTVVLDLPALEHFKSWSGDLGRAFGWLEKETVYRQKSLVAVKSGALRSSITSKRKTTASGLTFEAGSWTVEYAAANELGAHPHIIAAKSSPVLVFFWPKVGHTVFFKHVNHPGNKGYHWAERGLVKAVRVWDRAG